MKEKWGAEGGVKRGRGDREVSVDGSLWGQLASKSAGRGILSHEFSWLEIERGWRQRGRVLREKGREKRERQQATPFFSILFFAFFCSLFFLSNIIFFSWRIFLGLGMYEIDTGFFVRDLSSKGRLISLQMEIQWVMKSKYLEGIFKFWRVYQFSV